MRTIRNGVRWSLAGLLTLMILPACGSAQTTETEIQARLMDRPQYLRGQWSKDKLEFDEAGHLLGSSPVVSFTLAGVDISSVKLTPKELDLHGKRLGLEFTKDMPKRVGLVVHKFPGSAYPEEITIRIRTPKDGDFTAALNAIVSENLADLDPALPQCWQEFAQKNLLKEHSASTEVAPLTEPAGVRKLGGDVTAPVVRKKPEPEYSPGARAMRYSGISMINFILGADGIPTKVNILHPLGLGLDERAVEAVSQSRFKPAMEGGKPVAVELNVEVNFQIF
jgi:TonB family protein